MDAGFSVAAVRVTSPAVDPLSMGALTGKSALVTGGSRGLGRALCVALAQAGAHVSFNYKSADDDAAQTLELLRAYAVKSSAHKVSVLDKVGLKTLVERIEEDTGSLDILINNAGVSQAVPLALMEEADWDLVMDTNVKGAFLCSQAVLRGMVHRRHGRILNISSLAGVKMLQAPVHYCAAKAALKGFTEGLAKEVGRYGITVNCLAPGILEGGVGHNVPPARLQEYLRHTSLARVGKLEEIASVAAFLVAPENSYMNGATIVVDGAV